MKLADIGCLGSPSSDLKTKAGAGGETHLLPCLQKETGMPQLIPAYSWACRYLAETSCRKRGRKKLVLNSSFTRLTHHKHPAHGSVEGCCSGGGQLPKRETASRGRAGSDNVLVSTVSEVPRALWALWEFTVHVDLEGKKGVLWDAGKKQVLLCSGAGGSGDGEEEAGITSSPSCSSPHLHSSSFLLFLCFVPHFLNVSFLILYLPSYAHQ